MTCWPFPIGLAQHWEGPKHGFPGAAGRHWSGGGVNFDHGWLFMLFPQTVWSVWPHCGVTLRVRGWFRSRFAPLVGFCPECFPCAGPPKTRLRRWKFAFRLRESGVGFNFWRLAVAPWRFSFLRSWIRKNPHCVDTKRVSGGQIYVSYPARVSSRSILHECQVRVSCTSVLQECQVSVSHKSVR